MPRKPLRAVEPDEQPEILSVERASESGSRLAELRAIRRVIARAIDDEGTAPRDLAALSRRQLEISREIEAQERVEAEEAVRRDVSPDEKWSAAAL